MLRGVKWRRKTAETRAAEQARRMFETRTHAWKEAGLARRLDTHAIRRARVRLPAWLLTLAGIIVVYSYRRQLFGVDTPVRVGTVVALLILGWAIARDVGRAFAPMLFRRMDPATAGTVGFLVRLVAVVGVLAASLRIAGIEPKTLALGGAFTAIIAGLAAQQTLGNLFAGLVLLSSRPFRVGDRINIVGSGLDHTGVVSSLGLLFTSLDNGEDTIMIPNSTVLNVAITPLREPRGLDIRVRVPVAVTPSDIERLLREELRTPLRRSASVVVEELSGQEVTLRIHATPARGRDQTALSGEVLSLIAAESARAVGEGSVPT